MTKMIRNEREFLDLIGADDRKGAERRIYKDTDCGAWIAFKDPGPVPSSRMEKWTVRVRLSIVGALVVSVRKDHGKSITQMDEMPESVLKYLSVNPKAKVPDHRRRIDLGAEKPGDFFRDLEGRKGSCGTKIHPFEVRAERKSLGGITVGSIVEGTDAEPSPFTLEYPFTEEEFDKQIADLESEVTNLWNETHGCDDCNLPGEFGGNAVNPDCKTCHGEGTIL